MLMKKYLVLHNSHDQNVLLGFAFLNVPDDLLIDEYTPEEIASACEMDFEPDLNEYIEWVEISKEECFILK